MKVMSSATRRAGPVSVNTIFEKLLRDGKITVFRITPDMAERLRAFLASKRSKLSGKFEELGLPRVEETKVLTYSYDDKTETATYSFADRQAKFGFFIEDPDLELIVPPTQKDSEQPDAPV